MTRLRVLDPTAYTADDVAGTLAALGPWWAQLIDGRDEADALVITQAADTAAVVSTLGANLGLPLSPAPDDDLGAVVSWLDGAGTSVGAGVRKADPRQATAAALAAVTALDNLLDAGDRLRAAGVMPGTSVGTVAGLQRGDGGVPKPSVDAVTVTGAGVDGDRHATRRHHGRPWQALCLWSAEVIDALAADGHDMAPGHAGENVTLAGLPWADVRSGVRLRMGEVLAEVSVFALPCSNNAQWFSDGQYERIHHRHGAVSRVYAYVLEPGRIVVGDPAVLEPDELTGAFEGRAARAGGR